jgi:hypothetical protein
LPYGADPVPTLLTFNHAVFAKNQIQIGKHTRCYFKIDAGMLLSVRPVLLRVTKRMLLYVTYNTTLGNCAPPFRRGGRKRVGSH